MKGAPEIWLCLSLIQLMPRMELASDPTLSSCILPSFDVLPLKILFAKSIQLLLVKVWVLECPLTALRFLAFIQAFGKGQ